jgi:glycosyltransferase involved in cell wall biosynthesis
MKILLVHTDKVPWATTHRAEALKKHWTHDEVDIAYSGNLPDGDTYNVIHFLYSGGISKARNYILGYKSKTFTTLASQRTLDLYYDKEKHLVEIYKSTLCCVCQNPTLAKKLRDLIKQDNIVYIPNGVDEILFNRPFVVGFVGAKADNTDHKGYELVETACSELGLDLKTAHNGNVTDVAPHEVMPEFYKSIDCLVLASRSEGCNNPTLEALSMNIPVISTKVGIAEELEGVTLIDRDIESIKQALRHLSGRIQILEKYTWGTIAKQYHDLYESYIKA